MKDKIINILKEECKGVMCKDCKFDKVKDCSVYFVADKILQLINDSKQDEQPISNNGKNYVFYNSKDNGKMFINLNQIVSIDKKFYDDNWKLRLSSGNVYSLEESIANKLFELLGIEEK